MDKAKQLEEQLVINNSETKSKIKEDQIFVGNKPFMNYVRSAEILLRTKNLKLITIRARGKNTAKAIDLAEAVKNKFCSDLKPKISTIKTHTEKFTDEGHEYSVSIIEIIIKV